MSRRKQSNPKAVVKSQEEEFQAAIDAANIDPSSSVTTTFAITMTESTSPLSSPHAESTTQSRHNSAATAAAQSTDATTCNSPRPPPPNDDDSPRSPTSPPTASPTTSSEMHQPHQYKQQPADDDDDEDDRQMDSISTTHQTRTTPSPQPPHSPVACASQQRLQPNDVVQIKMECDDEPDTAENLRPPAPASPPVQQTQQQMPMLRLNTNLASDPALQPDAHAIQHPFADRRQDEDDDEDDDMADGRSQSGGSERRNSTVSGSVLLNELTRDTTGHIIPPLSLPQQRIVSQPQPQPQQPHMYMCEPCGIKFSTLSTLEAHQTYYCSHSRKEPPPPVAGATTAAGEEAKNAADGGAADGKSTGAVAQPQRVQKLYACSHCSYSADKKVSLNRHMRMHQTSPTTTTVAPVASTVAPNGDGGGSGAAAASVIVANLQQQQQQQQHSPQMQPQMQQLPMQIDRYCSDCDIRFSSTKTFRAHKQHYCSGRQRDGAQAGAAGANAKANSNAAGAGVVGSAPAPAPTKSRSQSPQDTSKSPLGAQAAAPPQPYLALPTNPIIIIPYAMIRSANILPGPLANLSPNIANPEQSCYTFKNGKLFPIAQALQMPPSIGDVSMMMLPQQQQQQQQSTAMLSPGQRPVTPGSGQSSHQRRRSSPVASNNSRQGRKREQTNRPTPTTPLDLSVQRQFANFDYIAAAAAAAAASAADDSHRHRSGSFSSTQSDDIGSNASQPPAPPNMQHLMDSLLLQAASAGLEASKENSNAGSNASTPEHIVCAPSLPGSPAESPSPPKNSLVAAQQQLQQQHQLQQQQLQLQHHQQQQLQLHIQQQQQLQQHPQQQPQPMMSPVTFAQTLMMRQLPADLAARLGSGDVSMMDRHNFELALRLSSAVAAAESAQQQQQQQQQQGQQPPPLAPIVAAQPSTQAQQQQPQPQQQLPVVGKQYHGKANASGTGGASTAPQPPQIFVKQGVSKCIECNIVFCKYENYLAHKKHYCSARNTDAAETGGAGSANESPGNSNAADKSTTVIAAVTGSPPLPDRSSAAPASAAPAPDRPTGGPTAAAPALAYQQLICAACGTKFASLDNLRAHQTYYCSKRIEQQQQQQQQQQFQQQFHQSVVQQTVVQQTATATISKCPKCKTPHDSQLPCPAAVGQQQQQQMATAEALAAAMAAASAAAYKCPMCEVVSSSAAESKRHLETHAGSIRAFRCSICGYRGNTQRGMRTHIRMHFEKHTKEFNEEHFISCILVEDGSEVRNVAAAAAAGGVAEGGEQEVSAEKSPMAPAAIGAPLYACDKCNYSSTFKGNVVRHNKLVHTGASMPQVAAAAVIGEGGESLLITAVQPASRQPPPALITVVHSEQPPHQQHSAFGVLNIKTEPTDVQPPTTAAAATFSPAEMTVTLAPAPVEIPPEVAAERSLDQPPLKRIKREHGHSPPVLADQHHQQQMTTTPVADVDNYCTICDIKFTYVNTYLAHKQYYCKAAAVAKLPTGAVSPVVAGAANAVSPQPTAVAQVL